MRNVFYWGIRKNAKMQEICVHRFSRHLRIDWTCITAVFRIWWHSHRFINLLNFVCRCTFNMFRAISQHVLDQPFTKCGSSVSITWCCFCVTVTNKTRGPEKCGSWFQKVFSPAWRGKHDWSTHFTEAECGVEDIHSKSNQEIERESGGKGWYKLQRTRPSDLLRSVFTFSSMFHIPPKQCHQVGYLYLRHEPVGDTETFQIETLQFGKLLFWFCFVFLFTKHILSFRNSGEGAAVLASYWCMTGAWLALMSLS